LVAAGFGPGFNAPLLVVIDVPASDELPVAGTVAARIARDPAVAAVAPPQPSSTRDAAIVTVVPRSAPQAPETKQLVDRLRSQLLPAATAGSALERTSPA
jgi:putative drug exporter of the RND superfamily